MSKEFFLYQINFNRKKYPEICKRLDEAKEDNGIAFYLRGLIERDIRERKQGFIETRIESIPESVQFIPKQESTITPKRDSLPDDNGGFI